MAFLPQEQALTGLKKLKQIIQLYDYYIVQDLRYSHKEEGKPHWCSAMEVNPSMPMAHPNPSSWLWNVALSLWMLKPLIKVPVWRLSRKTFPLFSPPHYEANYSTRTRSKCWELLKRRWELRRAPGEIERKAILEQTFVLCPKTSVTLLTVHPCLSLRIPKLGHR